MFHPGIFGPTSSHEDHLNRRTEDEDPTDDHSVLLCCSPGEIFWHNMNPFKEVVLSRIISVVMCQCNWWKRAFLQKPELVYLNIFTKLDISHQKDFLVKPWSFFLETQAEIINIPLIWSLVMHYEYGNSSQKSQHL